MLFIPRKDGNDLEALIDTDDLSKVRSFPNTWCALWSSSSKQFYVFGQIQEAGIRKAVLLHRLITDAPDGFDVDHINRDSLDNRRQNLRVVTRQRNILNTRGVYVNNTSGYRGVSWIKSKRRWRAEIRKDRRRYFLGTFSSKEDAKEAYNRKFREFFPGVPIPDEPDYEAA